MILNILDDTQDRLFGMVVFLLGNTQAILQIMTIKDDIKEHLH